jgi:hypothetical protein
MLTNLDLALFVAAILFACTLGTARAECVDYADYIHRVGGVSTPGEASGVAVSGTHAYVANGSHGFLVIDISDPGWCSQRGRFG